jgi:Lar family restriction alleviation protein
MSDNFATEQERVEYQQLKPCPFCGGKAECLPVGEKGYARVSCKNVVTCGHYGSAMPSKADAAQAWNMRTHADDAPSAEPAIHWRCFHCNYIARTKEDAAAHFGPGFSERPASCLAKPAEVQAPSVPDEVRKDAERLDWLESEIDDLRAVTTGDDDYEWVVISHHIAKPHEREIGRGKTARAAIDAALAEQSAKAEGGAE